MRTATLRVLCGVLVSCGLVLALAAVPASAVTLRLPSGKGLSYEPTAGADLQPALGPLAALSLSPFDAFAGNVDYGGGPVMASNTNYAIAWDPSDYSGAQYQSGYLAGVGQFFTDIADDSGLDTNSDSVAVQYNDASGQVAAYDSSFGGSLTDTDPLPSPDCSVLSGDACVTDAQVQAELSSFLTERGLPQDLTHEYFLLPPPGLAICAESSGGSCSANGFQPDGFCAYHAASTTSPSFIYAVIPDMAGFDGCDPYATSCPSARCDYPNSPADGVLTSIEHEHIESITDPEIFTGWNDWSVGSDVEVADICLGVPDPNTVDNRQPDGDDAPYNEVINGHDYWLQMIWSNQTLSCADHLTPDGTTASASFTQSAGSGTTVNFDASASSATGGVAEYEWQFNDDIGAVEPQTTTVETASPTISHTFPQAGTYTVALTVMASDGTSDGTAHVVEVQNSGASVPSNVSLPTISGTAMVGDVLTEAHGSWTNSPTSYSYQWEDCNSSGGDCVTVADATSQTYVLTSLDLGERVRVEEYASNSGGTSAPATSAATATVAAAAVPAPSNVSLPTISGTATVGDVLTEAHGSWTNSPTSYSYQWEDCNSSGGDCVTVADGTSQTYVLTSLDLGETVRVEEYASNSGGTSAPATSTATATVAAAATGTEQPAPPGTEQPAPPVAVVVLQAPVSLSPPTVSGTAMVGDGLTEAHGSWSNSPTGYSYQWEDCDAVGDNCLAIAGATGQAYTLMAADAGHTIRVVEIASDASGDGNPATSSPSAAIKPMPSITTLAKVRISSKNHAATFRFAATGDSTGSGAHSSQCPPVRARRSRHQGIPTAARRRRTGS